MADERLAMLTVQELAGKIQKKEVSPVEVTDAVVTRIERLNPTINAYTTLALDRARDTAKAAEREIAAGKYRGPFHGIPVGIKDLTDTADMRTTYGSGSFRDYQPKGDGEVVRRLKEAGAVILGKTATHEVGYGLTTNNPYFGPTRNPWNQDCVPGGSSGGSGAAVAADMAILCNGSDGGGSIRIPSFFCGIFGVKPTLGLISRFGLMGAGTSTFGVEGPMGKSVTDCALALQLWAGVDPRDPFTRPVAIPDYAAGLQSGIKGMQIGISPDLFQTGMDPDVQTAYDRALKVMQEAGASVQEVRLPNNGLTPKIFHQVFGGEFAHWHRVLSHGRTITYSPDVDRWMQPALAVTLDEYLDAQVDRERMKYDYLAAFTKVDVLLGPTSPLPAPKIGQNRAVLGGQDYDLLMAVVCCTGPSNMTGMPAMSVPTGFSREGLPVGVQLIGSYFEEAQLLQVAKVLEDTLAGERNRKPQL